MTEIWTPEVTARFEALLQDHSLYYSEIANRLSTEFNIVVTKNAAIGKAKRMRVPERDKSLPLQGRTKSKRKMKYRKRRLAFEPRNVPLIDLEPGECKWPSGDTGNFTFCGLPQVEGQPYCKHHCAKAHK